MLGVEAPDASFDPFLAGPFGVPFDQQCPDFGGDLVLAHGGVTSPPGLVAQFAQVVADVGEYVGAAGVAVAGNHWNGGQHRDGPVVRAVQECLQAVLWNGTVGMTPLGHHPPQELAVVPLTDMAPSPTVVAWNPGDTNPLIRSFVHAATATYRH
jgi:hypothetical protein